MIQPGSYDITVQENGDFDVQFQLKDSAGLPIDLTACQVQSEIWTEGRTAKLADFTVVIDDAETGTFTLKLNKEQTGNDLQDAEYDVLVTNAAGLSYYWVRGKVNVEGGVTQ